MPLQKRLGTEAWDLHAVKAEVVTTNDGRAVLGRLAGGSPTEYFAKTSTAAATSTSKTTATLGKGDLCPLKVEQGTLATLGTKSLEEAVLSSPAGRYLSQTNQLMIMGSGEAGLEKYEGTKGYSDPTLASKRERGGLSPRTAQTGMLAYLMDQVVVATEAAVLDMSPWAAAVTSRWGCWASTRWASRSSFAILEATFRRLRESREGKSVVPQQLPEEGSLDRRSFARSHQSGGC